MTLSYRLIANTIHAVEQWKMDAECAIQGWGMLIEQAAESYSHMEKNQTGYQSAILKQLNINASSQVLRRL